ncbi:unnamed protein product [Calypogeia fissa]
MQLCFPCDSPSFLSRTLLVDSRGEATTEPVPTSDTNGVDNVGGQESSGIHVHEEVGGPLLNTKTVKEEARISVVQEETSERIIVPQQEEELSLEESPTKEKDEIQDRVPQQPTNSSSFDQKLADHNKIDVAASEDLVVSTDSEKTDNSIPSAETKIENSGIPQGNNDDSSVQTVELSSEKESNFEGTGKNETAEISGPAEDSNVDRSTVEVVKFFSEAKEDFEGKIKQEEVESSGPPEETTVDRSAAEIVEFFSETKENSEGSGTTEDLRLETRNDGKIGDQSGLNEGQVHTSIQTYVPSASEKLQKNILDTIANSGIPTERSVNSSNAGAVDLNVPLRGGSPQGVQLPEKRSCEGRRAYVYTLPPKFNADLVRNCGLITWTRICDYFANEGMGQNVTTDELNDRGEKVLVPDGSWFLTHQYSLELIFHARLKHYECLTTDVNRADLFFVPYYAGLDVMRFHFQSNLSNDRRDALTFELMKWLEGQEAWSRNNGVDHVFVLGKIAWDFRRPISSSSQWGSSFLNLPSMGKPTKLLIERDAWTERDIGVPHPTFFHPKDDAQIRTWLAQVEQSERRYLVSFAGMPRPNMKGNVRGHLIQQCLDHPDDCFLLRCVKLVCFRPDQTMNLFLHSHFCMQPPGDSATRRSVFDSLVGGCIPVLFNPLTAYLQYPWHLPRNASSYSVFIRNDDVMAGKSDIVAILKSIIPEERTAMRTRIIREIIPGLLYSQPGTKHSDFRDAFDISMEALFHRLANLRAEKNST